MGEVELDSVDEALLQAVARDSRSTLTELADGLSVSANTAGNRLRRLEDAGVIQRYTVDIEPAAAGLPFHWMFHCTVSIADREELADRAASVPGVNEVFEMMTGERNLLIEVLGRHQADITRIAHTLDDLGIRVVDETSIRRNRHAPLTYVETDAGERD